MTNNKTTIGVNISYTEHYKTLCKHAWYGAGRPDKLPQIMAVLPKDEYKRIPDESTVTKWRDSYMWDAWADEMDAQAEHLAEDKLVNQRLVMLVKQASLGAEIQLKALNHLRAHGFDTSSSAVAAIKLGIDVERTSRGISDRLAKLAKLSDEQLTEEAQKLLDEAMESGEIIDMSEVPEEIEEDAEV